VNQPEIAEQVGRDPERTPMQWDDSPQAGFTAEGSLPWLPLADDYALRNVAQQEAAPSSMLSFFRALTALRRTEPALNAGDYASIDVGTEDIFAYARTAPEADRFLIVLNFGERSCALDLGEVAAKATITLNTGMTRGGAVDLSAVTIGPNEGLVLRLA
jgi:alpha-glucosidase